MYSWKDHAATGFAFFGYAIPNFFFGIILLLIFGVWLEVIPMYNTDVSVFSVQNAVQLSVPVFVLVTGSIGAVMRVSRNESAEFQNAEFMKTAKGQGRRAAAARVRVPRHAADARAAVDDPRRTAAGAVPRVVAARRGRVRHPGIGRVTYNALIAQDTNLLLGSTLAFTFIAVIGNLLEDLVFTVLDPRISFDDR